MHSTTMRPYNEISENNNPFPETYGGILSSAFEIGEFYTCKKLLIFSSSFSSIKNYNFLLRIFDILNKDW